MRIGLVFVALLATSCGSSQQPNKGPEVAYNPELFEMCIVEDLPDQLPVCVRKSDARGRTIWKFPLSETDELKKMQSMKSAPGKGIAARYLASQLIKRPASYKCGGNQIACARMMRQVQCEAEVARTELIWMRIESMEWLEAFELVSEVVRTGPAHFHYEDVPNYLAQLKVYLPSGATETCLTQYNLTSKETAPVSLESY